MGLIVSEFSVSRTFSKELMKDTSVGYVSLVHDQTDVLLCSGCAASNIALHGGPQNTENGTLVMKATAFNKSSLFQ